MFLVQWLPLVAIVIIVTKEEVRSIYVKSVNVQIGKWMGWMVGPLHARLTVDGKVAACQ